MLSLLPLAALLVHATVEQEAVCLLQSPSFLARSRSYPITPSLGLPDAPAVVCPHRCTNVPEAAICEDPLCAACADKCKHPSVLIETSASSEISSESFRRSLFKFPDWVSNKGTNISYAVRISNDMPWLNPQAIYEASWPTSVLSLQPHDLADAFAAGFDEILAMSQPPRLWTSTT